MKYLSNYRHNVANMVTIVMTVLAIKSVMAVNIAPMTWNAAGRSDWVNVKSAPYSAVGDGVADDTVAIQSAINQVASTHGGTVYFPAGTYKITSTLQIYGYFPNGVCNLAGCGIDTTIKWAGPAGGAMVWANSASQCRYVGFVWDGGGTGGLSGTGGAGCAFLEYSSDPGLMNQATPPVGGGSDYMSGIRHENESFRNFTVNGNFTAQGLPPDSAFPGGFPPSAIISGFDNPTNGITTPVGEVTVLNCRFLNCANGLYNPVEIFNNFMWVVDGCEFDNNGTGFNSWGNAGGDFVFLNSHFQGSTVGDMVNGVNVRGQRLTSSGSAQFYNGFPDAGFMDCWIDGWTNSDGAIDFAISGQDSVVDCTFTHPPSLTSKPIYTHGYVDLFLSNNTAPDFPPGVGLPDWAGMVDQAYETNTVDSIPAGSLGGNITSPTQTFLKSTYPADGTTILDVTKAPYNAKPDFVFNPDNSVNDSTAAIQAAITQAISNNNGTIVYIPTGFYIVTAPLVASGSNFVIEGNGLSSEICWCGPGSSTILTVPNPQNVTIRQIEIAVNNNLPGNPGAQGFPWCDPTTVDVIKETATGASSATYDNVICSAFNTGNPAAAYGYGSMPGLVFSDLPAGSTVYIPMLSSPLTVNDCGQAQIFSLKANIGAVNVLGATLPKTGYLGLMVAEGGQGNPSLYNFTVNDDQNLLVGPYYSEQCANDLSMQGGAGTTPGHVAIQGLTFSPTPTSQAINVNNYTGRLFYPQQDFSGGIFGAPVSVTQTGSNPIDMILTQNYFYGPPPSFTVDSGANLIVRQSFTGSNTIATTAVDDRPATLTADDLASIAQGLDDFRQLGALNLAVEYGQVNPSGLVAYWKLDEPVGPSADSSMSGATGTWQNGPTFSTDRPDAIPYADPGSMSFNGGYQYINMGTPTGLPTGTAPRTICGWAKSPSSGQTGPYGYGMFACYGSPANGEGFWIGGNGTALCAGSWGYDLPFIPNFWDGNWHFIALTYDGTTAKLYADGVLKESVPETWNLVPSVCYVGCYLNNSCNWHGNIDDVRIYNRALSDAEVAALAGASSTTGDLITGVSATSTSGNAEGNPGFTTSNNSVVAGPSGILGASDSMGDSGFNQDASDFGNFVTNLSGANITYDLGANYNVNDLLIWNFSQSGFANAGANSVTILSSTDNVTFTTVGTYTFSEVTEDPGYGSSRAVPGNNPPYATGGAPVVPAQVLPVTIPNARYIKLVINSNWGFTGGLVGINEVNFLGTPGLQTYDLANDWNPTSDSAANTWCYGVYSTAGNPASFSVSSGANYTTSLVSGIGLWYLEPSQVDPNVEKNVSSSDIFGAGIDWAPGKVSFGPFTGPSVARFTAPAAGTYNISAAFQTDQIRGTETSDGTTGYVYIGGTNAYTQELFDPGAVQFGTVASFTDNNVTLTAGETVDFVVGNGAFTTQVSATVTQTGL